MAASLLCIALTIFMEARGEPKAGQEAVAHVVRNRAEIRNMTECEVLMEKGQFSWKPHKYIRTIRDKKGKTTHVIRVESLPITKKEWGSSMAVAQEVLLSTQNMQNIEFFHAKYVDPGWKSRLKLVFRRGNHVFYARKDPILASL